MFFAQKSKRLRLFLRDGPSIFAHVFSLVHPEAWPPFFFPPNTFGLRGSKFGPNFPNHLNWRKIMQNENEKNHVRSGLFVRAHRRRAKFHGLTRNNGVDFGRGINFRRLTCTSLYSAYVENLRFKNFRPSFLFVYFKILQLSICAQRGAPL